MKTLSNDTRRIAVASHIRPVPLVVVSYRADEGVRKLYLSGRDYWHGGHLYLGLIAQGGLSDISYSLKGIGGIATLSSATLRLVNATDNPNLPLSAMLKDYTLINQDVTIDYLFEPATETIRIFSGKIQDVSVTRQGISLTIQNTTFDQLQSVPAHLASLSEYPNIPLSNAERPIPVVFGNLNTPPADNREAKDVLLAPCMNLDFLTKKYTAGARAKRYGDVYLWTGEGYFLSLTSAKEGETFTALAQNLTGRTTVPKFRESLSNNEITGDFGRGTKREFQPFLDTTRRGEFVRLRFRVEVQPGSNYRTDTDMVTVTPKWNGKAIAGKSLTGRTSRDDDDPNAYDDYFVGYIEIVPADAEGVGWDLSSFSFEIALRNNNVDYTFLEFEITYNIPGTPQTISENIFQSIEGYKDTAANYADGGVVNAADTVLSSPLDIAHALLRDKKIGMGMPTAQVDRSAIVQDRAKMPAGYRFDFSMNEAHGFDAFSKLLAHGLLRMWFGADGKWKIKPYSTRDAVVAHFNGWNILRDTFHMKKSPVREIYNHFFLRYGWHEALGYYTKSLIRSHHTKRWGTGTLSGISGANATLSASVPNDTLQSDSPINAGDRIWFDGDYYTVRAAATQTATALNLSVRKEDGNAVAKRNKPYYLGANFDYRCWQSAQRYGIEQSYKGHESQAIESKYIQDDSTARAFLDALIQYYGQAEDIATFQTGIGAVALDPGDVISIDHPLLGPADAARGALNQAISWPDTAFGITQPTAGGLGAGDVIVLEDADTGAFEMIRITSASGGRVTACERGYGNGIPRRWGSGHAFARVRKKWQITDIGLNLTAAEATITARSVRAPAAPAPPVTAITGGAAVRLADLPAGTSSLAWDAANERILFLSGEVATTLALGAYDPAANAIVDLAPGVASRNFRFQNRITGTTFLAGVLYGLDAHWRLYRWNADFTSMIDLGVVASSRGTAQAISALGDTLYIIADNFLYSINLTTRTATRISSSSWGRNFFSMCQHSGKLYTVDWEPPSAAYLYTLNAARGTLNPRVSDQTYAINAQNTRGPTSLVGVLTGSDLNGIYATATGDGVPSPFYRIP